MAEKKNNIVLGVTGSIAAYKACDIINALRKGGFSVVCIMTKEAANFITPLSLQTLSCDKVYTDMFERLTEWEPMHIALADTANLLLIAPACANTIGKLANGIYDDLLTCVAASTRAPILIAPAMNENMYKNKVVQENIEKLKNLGYSFVGPIKGELACGRVGLGHIAPVEDIVKEVKRLLR